MVPRSIRKQLGRLRRREIFLRLAWGGARWLALTLTVLLFACWADWAIDKDRDTPEELRQFMFIVQVNVAGLAGWRFLVRPLILGGLRTDRLALLVENKFPELQHRLITAVQLNRRRAKIAGMSPALIAEVTREAEQICGGIKFTRVAGRSRLFLTMLTAAPILATVLCLWLHDPNLAEILVVRQFLKDREIPRSLTIEGIADEIHPIGEPVTLRFEVKGHVPEDGDGEALIEPDSLLASRYPLVLEERTGPGKAIFLARVPPMSTGFAYHAWLADGRMRQSLRIRFVPRPVVEEVTAWVLLPTYCDPERRRRFPQLQPWGDITGIPGSWGRVRARIQKPVKEAFVELLAPSAPADKAAIPPTGRVTRKIKLEIDESGTFADGSFELRDEETRYRVIARDEYGFVNIPPAERKLRIVPEEPPRVALLPEVLAPSSRFNFRGGDFDMEGIPMLLGGSFPIAYTCSGHFGLGHARLLFRIWNKADSGNDSPPAEDWRVFPLPEVKATTRMGKFDPHRGTFTNSSPGHQVFFHAVSFTDPSYPLRSFGGGRFDFKTAGIPDGKGGLLSLKAGDQIEYCIEVFADRDPNSGRPSTRSETRVKTLVEYPELIRWINESLQETRRLREVTARQTGVFEQK